MRNSIFSPKNTGFVTWSWSVCAVLVIFLSTNLGLAQEKENKLQAAFVNVKDVTPSIVLDLRYLSEHNFVGKRINGYHVEKCILTREAAVALRKVQGELVPFNLSLKIYDAYRPQRAVDHFVEWAKNLADTSMKREFYPTVEKKHLFRDGYIASKSSHSRGSTVDLTIVSLPLKPEEKYANGDSLCECTRPAVQRFGDNSLDMGTGYDCFDTLSWTADRNLTENQRANRLLLKTLMEKHGFKNYSKEWWHFTLQDEPFPDTYFDFVIE
ncbi:MAG: D-alanyl-D-alanine dipeptidase [Calditrichaeota bacterium]|nr:MAG: D-alanyl-D-alanine dipeptidase [Calditrichota bacterium]